MRMRNGRSATARPLDPRLEPRERAAIAQPAGREHHGASEQRSAATGDDPLHGTITHELGSSLRRPAARGGAERCSHRSHGEGPRYAPQRLGPGDPPQGAEHDDGTYGESEARTKTERDERAGAVRLDA